MLLLLLVPTVVSVYAGTRGAVVGIAYAETSRRGSFVTFVSAMTGFTLAFAASWVVSVSLVAYVV